MTGDVSSLEVKDVLFIITLLCSTAGAGVSFAWWFNRQLSANKRELYAHIAEQSKVVQTNRERLGLIELSNKHYESRMDLLEDKIDGIQIDITENRADVGRLNQKISENHLTVLSAIQHLGDKLEFQKALSSK